MIRDYTQPLHFRTLPLDDGRDKVRRKRLDIGVLRQLRIGHDRRRVRIDKNDFVSLFAQCLAGLRSRIIEFARLADDNRPRADDQDRMNVSASGHCSKRPG